MNICAIVAKYFAKVGPKFCQILNKPQKGDIDEVLWSVNDTRKDVVADKW